MAGYGPTELCQTIKNQQQHLNIRHSFIAFSKCTAVNPMNSLAFFGPTQNNASWKQCNFNVVYLSTAVEANGCDIEHYIAN